MKRRALVSVSDKTNLVPFVQGLMELGFEIISTGGTKRLLDENGCETIAIDDVTGFPEILDGRVKTLHPLVHGGLLAVRDEASHQAQVEENGINYIDLVCVNLYPFKETISKPDFTHADAIENIDIGGPSMLRSAAKNHRYVTVVTDQADYDQILVEMKETGDTTIETRERLAAKVFRQTAAYDAMIADYLTTYVKEENPEKVTVTYDLKQSLRYGENPHQKASFYKGYKEVPFSIANATQLHGKELSYNNINDTNAALQISREYTAPVVVALKHANPCGIGIGENINEAWDKAYASDSTSIFGGIIATNQEVSKEVAEKMHKIFLEIVIAPSFSEGAIEVLTQKKNIRLLTVDMIENRKQEKQYISVNGGMLIQDLDQKGLSDATITVPTKRKPTEQELIDLEFAWRGVKHVKSNAILLAKGGGTVGVGAGQMNRVGAAKIAIEWAGDKCSGAVMASDAFFPMPDTVELAVEAGITAIIQPGGSIRDEDSIKVCDEHGIAMVFTGMRHFKH